MVQPPWYHLSAEWKPINNMKAKCLLQKHNVITVADLIKTSARLCHLVQHLTHWKNKNCQCQECACNQNMGCSNLHKCTIEALARLNLIPPKYNLIKQEPPDRISLIGTQTEKWQSQTMQQGNHLQPINHLQGQSCWILLDLHRPR